MENRLSVVIPCYNEELNLPIIYERINALIMNRTDVEFILVNNGSKDNSQLVFDKLQQTTSNNMIKVVIVHENKGYGYGILKGLESASGDVLAWTHADLQTDIKDVLIAFELYNKYQKNIFIKGKRKKRKVIEAFFTFGMQLISFFVLGNYLDDINAQPKLFTRNFYKSKLLDNPPLDFSLDLFALYQAKNEKMKILEVPVFFRNRQFGTAKGGGGGFKARINLIIRTFKYIFELKRRIA